MHTRTFSRFLTLMISLLLCVGLFALPQAAQAGITSGVCYVKGAGSDTTPNDGSTWALAFATLQKALDTPECLSIDMAEGTYGHDDGAKALGWTIKRSVSIQGGWWYDNGNSRWWQTTSSDHATILSGKYQTTYAPHVLLINNNVTVRLDSLTIQDGKSVVDPQSTALDNGMGGGIYIGNGEVTLYSVTVIGNSAELDGGGVYHASGTMYVSESTFGDFAGGNPDIAERNTAGRYGGGFYNQSGSPVFSGSNYIANNTAKRGGGFYNQSGDPVFETPTVNDGDWDDYTEFSGNVVQEAGGGMYSAAGNPSLRGVEFYSNAGQPNSQAYGGGMFIASGAPVLTLVGFDSNSSVSHGGGLHIAGGTPKILGSYFYENEALFGGAVSVGGGSPSFVNTEFYGNTTINTADPNQRGGALYQWLGTTPAPATSIINCTFAQNDAYAGKGGAIYNTGGTIKIGNSILWDDGSEEIVTVTANKVTATYSDIEMASGVFSGTGNINDDPKFIDIDNDNLHLIGFQSPAVDKGSNALVPAGTPTDYEGRPRFYNYADPLAADAPVDMGAYEANIIYVDHNAKGVDGLGSHQTGFSWADAYLTVEDALNEDYNSDWYTGAEIWVADGTYTPGTDRSATYSLERTLYVAGGFQGTEKTKGQRQINTLRDLTVLSGDIGTAGDTEDNVYHVVTIPETVSSPTVITLDGLQITAGNASYGETGVSGTDALGGGLYAEDGAVAQLTVQNVSFFENQAILGAGFFNTLDNPLLQNVTFSGNRASGSTADGPAEGGAIYTTGSMNIAGALFEDNKAESATSGLGGGIYLAGGDLVVSNATFVDNTNIIGAGLPEDGHSIYLADGVTATVSNSILWHTEAFLGQEFNVALANVTVSNNIIRTPDPSVGDPATTTDADNNQLSNVAGYPQFVDEAGENYHLQNSSPAIEAGSNTATGIDDLLPSSADELAGRLDLDNRPRLVLYPLNADYVTAGNALVDIGAYEARILHVKVDAAGENNGDSWTDAYTDLNAALRDDPAVSMVWVARGTYAPVDLSLSDPRDASFFVPTGVSVLGGFAGDETSFILEDAFARDWSLNETILSGNLSGRMNAYHVVSFGPDHNPAPVALFGRYDKLIQYLMFKSGIPDIPIPTTYDENLPNIPAGLVGFTVRDGNALNASFAEPKGKTDGGGGIYNDGGAPLLGWLTVTANTGFSGGGMYTSGEVVIWQSTFKYNTAAESGGGVFVDTVDIHVLNTLFLGNRAVVDGGGLYIDADNNYDQWLYNTVFDGNRTVDGNGGAVGILDGNLELQQTTLTQNYAGLHGGGIFTDVGAVIIQNSILWNDQDGQLTSDTDELYIGTLGTGAFTITYTDIQSDIVQSGTETDADGNINTDPLFIQPAGPDGIPGNEDDNLGLAWNSPAIDQGDVAGPIALFLPDPAGNPRLYDVMYVAPNAADPAPVDMGAYEAQYNTAPDLSGSASLDPVDLTTLAPENPGTLVDDLLHQPGLTIADLDVKDAEIDPIYGMAITAADTTHGKWQYTLNGTDWIDFASDTTSVADASALVLKADATTAIRFVADDGYRTGPKTFNLAADGKATLPAITFRAWDGTDELANGTGGVDTDTVDENLPQSGDPTAYSAETAQATVKVWLNHQPAAGSVNYRTAENTAVAGTLPGSDADGETLTFSVAVTDEPQHGQLDLETNGAFVYTPDAAFYGFDYFSFEVCDPNNVENSCADGIVSIEVTLVNQAPVAVDQTVHMPKNAASVTGTLQATDMDGNGLTFTKISSAQHGAVTVNANGAFTYEPAAGYAGQDSFTWRANDGSLNSNTATVSLVVNIPASAYVAAVNQSALMALNEAVSGKLEATSSVGAALSYEKVSGPAHGSLVVAADGTYRYTPAANYTGKDEFSFAAKDGQVSSNVARVTLLVGKAGAAPAANALRLNAASRQTTTGQVSGSAGAFILVKAPEHGVIAFRADGSFSYTPQIGYYGTDSFTFQVFDGTLFSSAAVVSLTVDRPASVLAIPIAFR